MKTAIKRLLPSFLLLVLFVVICARLGMWQWDRAAQFNDVRPEQPVVALEKIASPSQSLDSDAIGRKVFARGNYINSWLVPDRAVGDQRGTWQVALLDTGKGAVLVVRSWNQSNVPDGVIEVRGRLYPAQNPESSTAGSLLSRVDPALIVNQVNAPLYDGFIIASAEEPQQVVERVPSPQPTRNPPGFYWQHVSYVILWWFFGLIGIVVWLRSAREVVKR